MAEHATIHRLPTVGQRLVEAGQNLGRWQFEVIRLAGELDTSDEWLLEANSPAHWIADSLDMCVSTAREWVRIGKSPTRPAAARRRVRLARAVVLEGTHDQPCRDT